MNTTASQNANSGLFRSRATLLFIVMLFLLPALFAFISLKTEGWKSSELTHHGELILPPSHIDQLQVHPFSTDFKSQGKQDSHQALPKELWQILYIVPKSCDEACMNSQYISQQVRTGLGPERHRISTHFIHLKADASISNTLAINGQEIDLSTTGPFKRWQLIDQKSLDGALDGALASESEAIGNTQESKHLSPGYLYLADPLGNIMMKYKISTDFHTALQQAKGLKKDLKKLLKLSRIG